MELNQKLLDFIEEAWCFYGEDGIYPEFLPGLTKEEIRAGLDTIKDLSCFETDTFGRELLRDYLLFKRGTPPSELEWGIAEMLKEHEKQTLSAHFDPSTEQLIYDRWERSGAFKPSNQGEPFFIPMPPPNITGELHLGHALFLTLQDIQIRHHRMQGRNTLWIPGADHAGIAAQQKIEDHLAQAELDLTPENLDFCGRHWESIFIQRISKQIRAMGASADWDRFRYTKDDQMAAATTEAFLKLCKKGYIEHKQGRWLFKLDDLAKQAIAALDSGALTIEPAEQAKTYRHYLENIHDWEISRQTWWGHQIPAWSTEDGDWILAHNQEEADQMANLLPLSPNATLTRSPDRFDTWFTSALWPFAILGWPNTDSPDYQTFFPAALLETGHDILFFWGARMIMISLALTGEIPFKTIYLHGLIRDSQNRKMSKSLGNGIDPLEFASEYGTDALRFGLAINTTAGQDMKLSLDKFKGARRFTNKIWQASRFILARTTADDDDRAHHSLTPEDAEFLSKLEAFSADYKRRLDELEFQQAAKLIYDFFWNDFANGYLEQCKTRFIEDRDAAIARYLLRDSLRTLLKLLHPITPFITEEIWGTFNKALLIGQGS